MLLHASLQGGLFAILVFWHFFADWIFQSEKEALAKALNWQVRFRHVGVYTTLFLPLFMYVGFWDMRTVLACAILWVSHFIIDTYWPVMMWAKYLRRADQFNHVKKHGRRTDGSFSMTEQQYKQLMEGKGQLGWSDMVVDEITYANDREAFKAFFMTPIGGLLCITIDQLCHIACLIPVVWLMMP